MGKKFIGQMQGIVNGQLTMSNEQLTMTISGLSG